MFIILFLVIHGIHCTHVSISIFVFTIHAMFFPPQKVEEKKKPHTLPCEVLFYQANLIIFLPVGISLNASTSPLRSIW